MTHTTVLHNHAKGLNLDIDPNATISPSGSDNTSVRKNSEQVTPKPSSSLSVTEKKSINPRFRCQRSGRW